MRPGAIHREGNKLVGLGVQFALVPPRQKLGVAGYHSQRLLQIVRGDVGKLPQFLVRAVQFLDLMQQILFRLFAQGDVADRRRHQDAFRAFERAQHDLDRELAAILVPSGEFNSGADLLRQRVFRGSQRVRDQPFREAFRNDVLYRLPNQFVAAVAKLLLRPNIQQDDLPSRVHHHHRIGSGFQKAAISAFHLTKVSLGGFAHADVADRCRHQDAFCAFEGTQHDLDGKLTAILCAAP